MADLGADALCWKRPCACRAVILRIHLWELLAYGAACFALGFLVGRQ